MKKNLFCKNCNNSIDLLEYLENINLHAEHVVYIKNSESNHSKLNEILKVTSELSKNIANLSHCEIEISKILSEFKNQIIRALDNQIIQPTITNIKNIIQKQIISNNEKIQELVQQTKSFLNYPYGVGEKIKLDILLEKINSLRYMQYDISQVFKEGCNIAFDKIADVFGVLQKEFIKELTKIKTCKAKFAVAVFGEIIKIFNPQTRSLSIHKVFQKPDFWGYTVKDAVFPSPKK